MKKLRYVIALLVGLMPLLIACSNDDEPTPQMRMETFDYAFNEGQLVGESTAYMGEHPRDLMASLLVEELPAGNARISITLNNTLAGETYMVHAHDMADPDSTPNGTPYLEAPNANVFVGMPTATGTSVMYEQETSLSYDEVLNSYDGFLVVHDPTQELSTTDLTTYLVLGVFAR
ncbi:hypothetical protein KIH41_10540 [Litoribacter ruber]|uniref:CHRD domain-containing protein n=1 Tax=Litoribacter ruber TaxID=702568 RepID=A0AAP2G6F4_9BACT|nr:MULTISPECIES: hypothetical protein [Litoribacter]MBS9526011.1 hypothetical protein [Litoribacter alkaliphilus]MBT0811713.1 hypothetical protein [Litoribacter ruber]